MDPLAILYFFGVQVPLYSTVTAAALSALLSTAFVFGLFASVLVAFIKFRLFHSKAAKSGDDNVSVGFFHPYCDAGGGGERVLWCAIKAMAKRYRGAKFVVYTGDLGSAPDQILERAKSRFQIDLKDTKIEFVYLHQRRWVEARTFPRFTLIGQSLGSLILGKYFDGFVITEKVTLAIKRRCSQHVYRLRGIDKVLS